MQPAVASLIAATIATGVIYLDQSAVNVILPAIQRDLDISVNSLQWILNSYLLFTTAPLLLAGVLGDRYGRVKVYLIGMTLFAAASLACGLAQSATQLILFRAVQGLGAAMIAAVGLAILSFHTPLEHKGKAIGTWAALTAAIIPLGPLVSGALTEWANWQLVFFISIPFALFSIWMVYRYIPENTSDNMPEKTNWASTLLLLSSTALFTYGMIELSAESSSTNRAIGLIVIGLAGLVWFFKRQTASPDELIPSPVFAYRRFTGVNIITLWQWIAISSYFFLLPVYLQWTQGYDALQAGMSLLPVSLSVMVFSRFIGRYTDSYGPVWPMAGGVAMITLAMAMLANSSSLADYWSELFLISLIYGIGLGALITPLTSVAMNSLPSQYSGIASGVNNTASRLSAMIAVAANGSLLVVVFRAELLAGLQALPLTEATRQQLIQQSSLMRQMYISLITDPQLQASVDALINAAIAKGFGLLMWSNVVIGVSTLVLLAFYHFRYSTSQSAFWTTD